MYTPSALFPAGLAALSLLSLSGCGDTSPAASLFPLDAGHRWAYEIKTGAEGGNPSTDTLTISTRGEDSIEGGRAWRRRADSGVDYWLRSDASGIYRVASKSDLDAEPKPDAQPRYVLKTPIVPGTTWRADTTAYLLKRRAEFPPEIRHTHAGVQMTYTIDAVGLKIDTRAGSFSDCTVVKGKATMKLFVDPVAGWRDMPLLTTEWYCKGVGLVRLERDEPSNSNFLTGGKLTMELVAWS
jgi:hypothetical protein